MLFLGLDEGGGSGPCEEVAGTFQGLVSLQKEAQIHRLGGAQEKDSGEVGKGCVGQNGERERENENDGARAQMCSLALSHWEDGPRGRGERTDSLVGSMTSRLSVRTAEPTPFSSLPVERGEWMTCTTQGVPAVCCTSGLPGGCCLPIPQVKQSRLKNVCDWLESQEEN